MNTIIQRSFAESLEIERNAALLIERAEAFLREHGFPMLAGGAAGAWTFTNTGLTKLQTGIFDIDSDTYKMALFLSTSNLGVASTTYAGVTNEHANANGYTTGGEAITLSISGTTTTTTDSTDATWTASGGSIVARFAAIYEVGGDILAFCLLDSTPADVTVTTGNQLTVQIHVNGIYQIAPA